MKRKHNTKNFILCFFLTGLLIVFSSSSVYASATEGSDNGEDSSAAEMADAAEEEMDETEMLEEGSGQVEVGDDINGIDSEDENGSGLEEDEVLPSNEGTDGEGEVKADTTVEAEIDIPARPIRRLQANLVPVSSITDGGDSDTWEPSVENYFTVRVPRKWKFTPNEEYKIFSSENVFEVEAYDAMNGSDEGEPYTLTISVNGDVNADDMDAEVEAVTLTNQNANGNVTCRAMPSVTLDSSYAGTVKKEPTSISIIGAGSFTGSCVLTAEEAIRAGHWTGPIQFTVTCTPEPEEKVDSTAEEVQTDTVMDANTEQQETKRSAPVRRAVAQPVQQPVQQPTAEEPTQTESTDTVTEEPGDDPQGVDTEGVDVIPEEIVEAGSEFE